MLKSKTKEFEDICSTLESMDSLCKENGLSDHAKYKKNLIDIAYLCKAEEGTGCSISQAKSVVACWWRDSDENSLTDNGYFDTCLSCFPLFALKRMYLKDIKILKDKGVDLNGNY